MIKKGLLVLGLASLLSACGFHLRGTGQGGQFAIKELDLSARNAYGETVRLLREQLEANHVKIHAGAPYELVLVREGQRQRIASYTTSGRGSEYELISELQYELHGKQDLPLTGSTVTARRVYMYDQNNITGSNQQAKQLSDEMRNELVQQTMMRLQQLTPSKLEQLQQKAEEQARIEEQLQEQADRQQNAPQQSPIDLLRQQQK
ncbi:LPS assembly lipoprotein LptE [Azotobacter bryophylli]|uniref:LPS-assembly lipoprotein LptE n=1 Tax=Azotobacter bryophylli TaxID=1986537 RepID=A0ABV7AY79_9GAMM